MPTHLATVKGAHPPCYWGNLVSSHESDHYPHPSKKESPEGYQEGKMQVTSQTTVYVFSVCVCVHGHLVHSYAWNIDVYVTCRLMLRITVSVSMWAMSAQRFEPQGRRFTKLYYYHKQVCTSDSEQVELSELWLRHTRCTHLSVLAWRVITGTQQVYHCLLHYIIWVLFWGF